MSGTSSGPSAWANLPSSDDDSTTLMGEKLAVVTGVVATLVGLGLGYIGLGKIQDTIGHLIWLLIALYVVGVVAQFWVAQSYKNGMTWKEITFALIWPLDVVRSLRRGVRAAAGQVPGRTGYMSDDNGPKVISQGVAFAFGILATVAGVILLFVGLHAAWGVFWSVFWLLLIAWIIGGIVQFWVAQSWRDGLTVKELIRAAVWPFGMASVIRAGVKKLQRP